MNPKEFEKLITKCTQNINYELLNQIDRFLDENALDKAKFARMIGCSKGYISQLFNNSMDHKISKLVMLSLAIGKMPVISFKDISSYSLHPSTTDFDISALPQIDSENKCPSEAYSQEKTETNS